MLARLSLITSAGGPPPLIPVPGLHTAVRAQHWVGLQAGCCDLPLAVFVKTPICVVEFSGTSCPLMKTQVVRLLAAVRTWTPHTPVRLSCSSDV